MSDDDYLVPGEVKPGMRVEILNRPWIGTVTEALRPDGTFRAIREDGVYEGIETSWAVDNIGSIRRLPSPLPVEPGKVFWGKADDHPAEWWFSIETPNFIGGEGICYAAASGQVWTAERAGRMGLVRIPDPDGAR